MVVFEHLFPEQVLEKREWTAFILGIIYSTLSIVIARLLFPMNSGIVSVVFLSIFLLPYFSTILRREERQEMQEQHLTFGRLFKDNMDIIRTYYFLFIGIYLTFMLYSFLAPAAGLDPGAVFREQLSFENTRGDAVFNFDTFWDIMLNNWWVLLACFLVALVAGDGAIFFVAWNASTWGTIFGYRALMAGMHGENALWALLVILLVTLPHVLLEGGAYILAAIAGGVISDQIVERSAQITEFVVYLMASTLLFVALYWLMRTYTADRLVIGIGALVVVLTGLFFMGYIFSNLRDRLVFQYNYQLFLLAVGVFIVAAVIEVLVLEHAVPLREVYLAVGG